MLFGAKNENRPVEDEDSSLLQLPEIGDFSNLTHLGKKASKQDLDKDAYFARLEEMKKRFPIRMIEDAGEIVSTLNRLVMKPKIRLELANAILGQTYSVMNIFYRNSFAQEYSLPENSDRRNALSASVILAEQLAIAYKHIFKSQYSKISAEYVKTRPMLQECGFRILEMLRLEQRMRALRYQRLPAKEWQDCNRVLFALLLHNNDVDEEWRLLGTIGFTPSIKKGATSDPLISSVRKLYLSMQLFGLLNTITWPLRFFHVPDSYLELFPDSLEVVADNGDPITPGWLITYLNNTAPPLFQRMKTIEPAIRIKYNKMFNHLVQDHEELRKVRVLKSDESTLSKPLLLLEERDRKPFLEKMLLGFKKRERMQKRHAVIGNEEIRLYFGFKDVKQLLLDVHHIDRDRVMKSREFIDTLAQSSANLADDDKKHMTVHWNILNFSSGGLLVYTEESDFTTPIQIGQIIAFSPLKEDIQQPMVGYVTRLNRPGDSLIELAIVRLSTYAETAIIQDEADEKKREGKAVIIIQDLNGEWKIIVHNTYKYLTGVPLKLIRGGTQQLPTRLGEVWMTQSEFTVHNLSAPGLSKPI